MTAVLPSPPNSLIAEQAVLGALLLRSDAWDNVADMITAADFYRRDHREIFEAIATLIEGNHACDTVVVGDYLERKRPDFPTSYLFELVNNTASAANIVGYARIVRNDSLKRQLMDAAAKTIEDVGSAGVDNAQDVLDRAEQRVFAIAESGKRGKPYTAMPEAMREFFATVSERYNQQGQPFGLATGFTDLDALTAGFSGGDLIILAARPSMGKTALALNIAEHASVDLALPTLVFSMEMSVLQLSFRLASSVGRIDGHKLKTGELDEEQWPRIVNAISRLHAAPLLIDDTPALTPLELRARARRVAREHGLRLIVVDYLQLMQGSSGNSKENRNAEISEISRSLKALAKELNVPVIALSQLNRSVEQRAEKRPVMSDLRESGAIEQDADIIMFIYRDEYYDKNSPDKGLAEVIIAKQRTGPTGDVRLAFHGNYSRFENYSHSPWPISTSP